MNDKVKDYPPYLDYPKERKPQTNADRIRAMTDEELASFIDHISGCPPKREDCDCIESEDDCEACWLDWLRQEAK